MSLIIKIGMRFLVALLLLLWGSSVSAGEGLAPIPVRIGGHDNFTRIVFESPKLMAYTVAEAGGLVRVVLDTKADAAVGDTDFPLIKKITSSRNGDGALAVDVGVPAGATFKHFRLERKIVLDIFPAVAAARKPPPAALPMAAAAAPVPLVKPLPLPVPAPEIPPKVEEKKQPPPPPDVPPSAAARTPEDGDEEDPEGITEITLSSLTPMRLAVFERFDALWIVTDSIDASGSAPVIRGPMAEFITRPKGFRFDGGKAYRYAFLKKFHPYVKKQGFLWEVLLLTEPPPDVPPSAAAKVGFDPASRKAKFLVSMKGAGDTIAFEDPDVGDMLYVTPVSQPSQAVRERRRFADFEILPAQAGMVVRPLKEGLRVHPASDVVLLMSPYGLTVTPEGTGTPILIGEADAASDDDNNRLFDFPNWRQGGLKKLEDNKRELQEKIIAARTPEDRVALLMKMARLRFSNNFGQETLGILGLVQKENPEVGKNPDFIALRGAANAMAGYYREALQDLSLPSLQRYPEALLWIGFAAAASEQWRMADQAFPKSNRLLLQYPENIAIPLTVYMAESALRLGHTDTATKLLDSINMTSDSLAPQYQAAINYLRGEVFSQEGKPDQAAEVWQPVADGLNRLYHAKASLSLTRLHLRQNKITLKEAIDRIDNLRFAWRGDGLEVEILRALGSLKVQDNRILSGLEDMKQAAELADSLLDDSAPIRDDMKKIFSELFAGNQIVRISPLEAISVYDAFSGLLPSGSEGVAASLSFADCLIRMDLLERAAGVIEDQIRIGIPDGKIAAVGAKLAAVYLLDARPSQALEALKETEKGGGVEKMREERSLLRVRAQSQLNQTAAAIDTLSTMDSRNARKLKADVLWRAQKWEEAAEAIEALLPGAGKALDEEEASLVVNAAVARKLAGNPDRLKEIRDKYGAAMTGMKLAATFGVVTRDGGASALADRETLLKIAGEVDMFKGFLNSYKASLDKGS
ncbi:MAG: hypothetical protein V1721_07335 [Pseudomonadota bacterium]